MALQSLNTQKIHNISPRSESGSDATIQSMKERIAALEQENQALKENLAMFQEVIDTIPNAIFWKDSNSSYLGCNKKFAKLNGLISPTDVLGRTDQQLQLDHTGSHKLQDQRVISEATAFLHELKSHKKNGHEKWFDTTKIPLRDQNGRVVGILGMSEDVSEKEALRQQRADFMAHLAHDLKVPVVGAVRALELLQNGVLGPMNVQQIDFVNKLHDSHENLLQMIQNLLQLLRHEVNSAESKMCLETVNFSDALSRVLADFQESNESTEHILNCTAQSEIYISADRTALKKVITNLITKSQQLSLRQPTVDIKLITKGNLAELRIQNAAEKLCIDDQEMMFHRFWHGSRFGAGAGLELYLCKQIIEGHGGTISCASQENAGTTFIISLPVVAQN